MDKNEKYVIARQDMVDNAVMDLIIRLAPKEAVIDWDIEAIGHVRDALRYVLVYHLGVMTASEFYPSIGV